MTSTITRQVMQVEGYEFDYIWDLFQNVWPTLTRPDDCPNWALEMWEACLRLPGRSVWSNAQRRASILARVGQAITEAEIKSFIATEARASASGLAFSYTVDYEVDITTTGYSADQILAVKAVSQLVIPAHMKIKVNTVAVR